tara:strand:+ start:429 stop:854 length:426 start_codon:yes stop_codon:yes gene_type:complete
MRSILEIVAYYIEYHQNNSVLNEREAEALASAKSLLIGADVVNKTFGETMIEYHKSLKKLKIKAAEEVEQPKFITGEEVKSHKINPFGVGITEGVLEQFAQAYGVPYEKFGDAVLLTACATSEIFPVGDGSFEFAIGVHLD